MKKDKGTVILNTNRMKRIINTIFTLAIISTLIVACNDPQSPGVEYMPDMYRSPAIEVYVDYNYPDSVTARKAPANSIPRGYKPYPYENTDAGYELAGSQLKNPLKLTEKTIKEGQKLYSSFCAHCHGAEGKGKGSITNAIYGAVPSYSDVAPVRRNGRSMSQLTEGHIYHTIMFGLNAMGPHSSLIREQDRWKIVAYVQKLQGKDPLVKKEELPMNDDTAMKMDNQEKQDEEK